MAIKSKGRSKSKQVARAPRRDPVAVPTPFFQRRWVQLVAVLIVGMFVFMMGVWVTNGLRSTHRTDAANATRSGQKTAMIAWQNALEPAISKVGQLNGPVAPTIAPTVTAAAANLAKGRPAGASTADLLGSAAALRTAAATIEKVDLVDTIRGKGFDLHQTEALLSSQVSIVAGLRGLEQAARLSVLAINAEGATKDQLAESAKALAHSSTGLIQDGFNSYLNALNDVGLVGGGQAPGGSPQLIPGG
ncbi:MAG TPA: hypothetical protein VLX89_06545 [Actinomycetota bacterium]|nr:hypothetical protein [Actinomycetota bacterium]